MDKKRKAEEKRAIRRDKPAQPNDGKVQAAVTPYENVDDSPATN